MESIDKLDRKSRSLWGIEGVFDLTIDPIHKVEKLVLLGAVVLKLNNSGFSAPINPRAVELVLVDGNGKKTVYEQNDIDPRYWFAGEKITIDRMISIPADATGECTLYLNLPDPKPTLHDNPLFSIRLANENVWDEATGYNKVLEFTL